jgi:hypothetical protein
MSPEMMAFLGTAGSLATPLGIWLVVILRRNGRLRLGDVRRVGGLWLPSPDDASWASPGGHGWICGPVYITTEGTLMGPGERELKGGAAKRYVRAVLANQEQKKINEWQQAEANRMLKDAEQ